MAKKIMNKKIMNKKIMDNMLLDNKLIDNKIMDKKAINNKLSDNELIDNKLSDNKLSDNKSSLHFNKTKSIILAGLLFAIAIVLSMVENSFPPIFIAIPGVKLGISNIAVMYALFFLGKGHAFTIGLLKALFVGLTRGIIAGFLTLSGGMLSIFVMSLLIIIFKDKVSYLVISIFGAVSHNIGQLIAICFVLTQIYIWVYLPVLLISGVFAGIATSTLLRFILPAFKRLS